MNPQYYSVAVNAPISEPLTYLSETSELYPRGASVEVPLGKRTVSGIILAESSNQLAIKIKAISSLLSNKPIINERHLKWLEWISHYYLHPIGQVVSLAFPPLERSTKSSQKTRKSAVIPEYSGSSDSPHELTQEQQQCYDFVSQKSGFQVHLLHGVTGSGKTEVYLRLFADVLKKGKKGLFLVPEISLTPQLVQRFSQRFPDQISIIHSQLTEREKTNQWWDFYDGKKSILIGARSALFCPAEPIGLIVVDEEHEPSYKQDEKLKYNARDAAIKLAQVWECPVVLGSATPSLESWHNVEQKKYHLLEMKTRVANRPLPEIEIIDLRTKDEDKQENLPFWLSQRLYNLIFETLNRKKQVALFLNRRGLAQLVLCQGCGYINECPNCAISLTLHRKNHLICHYCEYTLKLPDICPSCHISNLSPVGLGTELMETDLKTLFPFSRIRRADRDEIHSRDDLEQLVSDMENNNIDIVIGTQMIAKGLDFPNLELVGLVLADISFNIPDFRSSERSYQLITQMSGRAGRHSHEPGKVVVQTYNPEYPSLIDAKDYNHFSFMKRELSERRDLNYPPFYKLACIKISGLDLSRVQNTSQKILARAQALRQKYAPYEEVHFLGPAPSPLTKIRNRFRYHALIKSPNAQLLNSYCKNILGDQKWLETGTKVQIDIDPLNLM